MDNSLIIVIPCYNEYNRLPKSSFEGFLQQHSNVKILFCDDGSTDKTIEALNEVRQFAPDKVFIHTLRKNSGKAEAVREGVLYCYNNNFEFSRIAYLDADLSTSLEECLSISKKINSNIIFAFGSRILKIDTDIRRKYYRFLIGRFLATIISIQLGVTVYDSQCGCKVFCASLAKQIFQEHFISRWLFDVEIFHRIIRIYGKERMHKVAKEVSLNRWIDTDESKVKLTYFFRIWHDLIMIRKRYN